MPRFLNSAFLFWLAFASVAASALSAQESTNKSSLKKFAYSTPAMGVKLNIVVYCTDAQVEATIKAGVDAVNRVNEVFSDYSIDSEVGRLNGGGGEWVSVSDEFLELLRISKSISEKTDGNFDVTLGALTTRWRAARKKSALPISSALQDSLAVSGFERIELDDEGKRTRFPKGLKFDFGGIGKGYAADEALAAMKKLGYGSALVDLGGDVAVGDPPPGKEGWKVAIAARPEQKQAGQEEGARRNGEADSTGARFIQISNCGVATSGDVEQFVEVEGRRYSHLLDPKTGLGIQRQANVTIVSANAGLADALASAYSVMPYEIALQNRESFSSAEILVQELVDGKVVERHSKGFPKIKISSK